MNLIFADINWLAVIACVVAGQIFLTLWFAVIFGERWAKSYGGESMTKAQHTKEVPGYTYGIGAFCTLILTLSIALLQATLGISDLSRALKLGCLIAIGLSAATAFPGYAFLKRYPAFFLAAGSQVCLIFILSVILALWQK